MQLTFFPALGETAHVSIPPRTSARQGSMQELVFRAVFDSRASYDQAQRDGVKVEMWTDLPADGRASGEWGAVSFNKHEHEEPSNPESGAGHTTLSLLSSERRDTSGWEQDEYAFYASLSLWLHDSSPARFSFTYRLVYPSGEIQWLGTFGWNGQLVIERGFTGVSLGEGWTSRGGRFEFYENASGEREVGRLSGDMEWSSWAMRELSWPTFSSTAETTSASIILLFPHPHAHAISVPPPFIFSTLPGASIRITPSGSIVYTADDQETRGQSLLALDELHHDTPWGSIICHGLDNLHHIVNCDPESQYVVVGSRSPRAAQPAALTILPLRLSSGKVERQVHVEVSALDVLVPDKSRNRLALYCPSDKSNFVSQFDGEKQVTFLVGEYGGQVIVMPTYILHGTSEAVKTIWEITLMAVHSNALVSHLEEAVQDTPQRLLPTPPPSPPPIQRAAQRDPTSIHPSISEVLDMPGELPPSITPTRSASRSSSCQSSCGPSRPPRETKVEPNALALVHSYNAHPFQAYMRVLLAMLAWIWDMFLRRFTGPESRFGDGGPELGWMHLRSNDGISKEKDELNNDEADGQNSELKSPLGEQETNCVVDLTSCDPDCLDSALGETETNMNATYLSTKDAEAIVDAPEALNAPSPQPSIPSPISSFQRHLAETGLKHVIGTLVFSAEIWSGGGAISMFVRAPVDASPSELKFVLDNEPVLEPTIVKAKDGYLVDIHAGPEFQSGRLTVFVAQ
ncbi:hypothetical protein AcV7_000361 [Taiwanofungus camphoratus]|nr:hypothetical protein AcV7_000361 [Antrodia cinnamomea]